MKNEYVYLVGKTKITVKTEGEPSAQTETRMLSMAQQLQQSCIRHNPDGTVKQLFTVSAP